MNNKTPNEPTNYGAGVSIRVLFDNLLSACTPAAKTGTRVLDSKLECSTQNSSARLKTRAAKTGTRMLDSKLEQQKQVLECLTQNNPHIKSCCISKH